MVPLLIHNYLLNELLLLIVEFNVIDQHLEEKLIGYMSKHNWDALMWFHTWDKWQLQWTISVGTEVNDDHMKDELNNLSVIILNLQIFIMI